MNDLPSGLPAELADSETLGRAIISSSHLALSTSRIKHPAFLPAPDNETSVFRLDSLTDVQIRECAMVAANGRGLHGMAMVSAKICQSAGLEVEPKEPPPYHANLIHWPVLPTNPQMQKAMRKQIAIQIAEEARWLPMR
jgi:hypothetical protein